jgi:hypothetical protein
LVAQLPSIQSGFGFELCDDKIRKFRRHLVEVHLPLAVIRVSKLGLQLTNLLRHYVRWQEYGVGVGAKEGKRRNEYREKSSEGSHGVRQYQSMLLLPLAVEYEETGDPRCLICSMSYYWGRCRAASWSLLFRY